MKFIQVVAEYRNMLINVSDISVIQDSKENECKTDIFLRDNTIITVDHSYEEIVEMLNELKII